MRQLIVCCDGTWNTSQDESVTNVCRLYHALAHEDQQNHEQLRYYQPGVGTGGGLLDALLGGATGVGLSYNTIDAYRWITTTYRPGDRISLFGFSRGAYTARSVAGMIRSCGLIDANGMDAVTVRRLVKRVYENGYRDGRQADARWREGLTYLYDPENPKKIPIHFIGVWDTVGALGVPDYLGLLNLVDRRHRYGFHDLTLNPHIRYARQALALDERRTPYTPSLWTGPFATGQDVKQVWFPGSHKDVGGGHRETGLSDRALLWMMEEAGNAVHLGFDKAVQADVRPNPLDELHDDDRDVVGLPEGLVNPLLRPFLEILLEPRPRAVPLIDHDSRDPLIDDSAYQRCQTPTITAGPYRPTRVLSPGEGATVDVRADAPWNDTGLYLRPGGYDFTAEGEWFDAGIPSGPGGTTGLRRFNPLVERVRLLGTMIGQAEPLLRWATGNDRLDVIGSRRDEDQPWMSLLGAIANQAMPSAGQAGLPERIVIGTGTYHRVTDGGYFYAYANDAWGFYANNRGSLRLTVTMRR